jgi:hypothetical protein
MRPSAAPTASPAAVLGRLLYLVDNLDLAFLGLGEDGGVVGAHDVLAVEFLQRLQVGLCVVDTLVVTDKEEYGVVAHCVLSLLSVAFPTAPAALLKIPPFDL